MDDIFKANLHIGDNNNTGSNSGSIPKTTHFHKRTELAPANFYYDDFLGSPFIKENAIEEEEERLEVSFEDNEEEEEDEEEIEDLRLHINDGSDEALPPPSFYQSASANSSNSSLKRKLLRKPFPTHHQAHCLQHQDQEPKQVDIKIFMINQKLYQTQ